MGRAGGRYLACSVLLFSLPPIQVSKDSPYSHRILTGENHQHHHPQKRGGEKKEDNLAIKFMIWRTGLLAQHMLEVKKTTLQLCGGKVQLLMLQFSTLAPYKSLDRTGF